MAWAVSNGYIVFTHDLDCQGLREDLERLEGDNLSAFIESLKRKGVSEEIFNEALKDIA